MISQEDKPTSDSWVQMTKYQYFSIVFISKVKKGVAFKEYPEKEQGIHLGRSKSPEGLSWDKNNNSLMFDMERNVDFIILI